MNGPVIIVGAGPAGSAAALTLARAGVEVVVLEAGRFPRDKICGDALGLDCAKELEHLGLMDRVRALARSSFNGVGLSAPNGQRVALTTVDRKLPGFADHTFCIPRLLLDHALIEAAVEAGATLEEEARVSVVLQEEVEGVNTVVGVETRDGRQWRGPVVLGCAGEHDPVAKVMGRAHDPRRRAFAVRVYVEDLAEPVELAEIAFSQEVLPGYGWIFPVSPTSANVGVGLREDLVKARGGDLRGMLKRFMEDDPLGQRLLRGGRTTGPVKGWPLTFGTNPRRSTGAGWMLCGDAAGMIDPVTGEGIGPALLTGRLAAETLLVGDLSASGLAAYELAWKAHLARSFQAAELLQRALTVPWVANRLVGQAERHFWLGTQLAAIISGATPKTRVLHPRMLWQLLV